MGRVTEDCDQHHISQCWSPPSVARPFRRPLWRHLIGRSCDAQDGNQHDQREQTNETASQYALRHHTGLVSLA